MIIHPTTLTLILLIIIIMTSLHKIHSEWKTIWYTVARTMALHHCYKYVAIVDATQEILPTHFTQSLALI